MGQIDFLENYKFQEGIPYDCNLFVSVLNGTSAIVGNFMLKPPLQKMVIKLFNTLLGNKGYESFRKGITSKVNVN